MQRICLALILFVIGCVSASAQSGQVKWRFRMNGMYANSRPAVAADGTVYAVDVRGILYALTPEGQLKWSAAGAGHGVDVAPDGTVYAGDENHITAYNPNGTVKWTFTESPRALSLIGPNVGPDGNIYAVATEGLGVFSLTPQGQLRWSLPEPYNRPVVIVQNVVFGPSHLYFHANNHIAGVTLDGGARLQYVDGLSTQIGDPQPAVGPKGTLYSALQGAYLGAFDPLLRPLWTFSAQLNNTSSAPDVGTDGTVYVALNLKELFALNADGTQRWHVRAPGITDFVVASPRNDLVLGAGVVTYGEPGLVMGFSPADGALLWQTELPAENGGRIIPYSRPRFSPDGATAYFGTAILGQDTSNEYSYLYAIRTGQATPTPNSPPSVSLTSPSDGVNFVAPASVTLNADASDADGTISRVDFYNGSTLLGTATSAPYNYALGNVAAGSYTFTAVAFDNAGASTTSGTVTITVNAAPTPTPMPVRGTLQFSTAAYGVGEGGGTATISVRSTGWRDGAVSVNYATANGTAAAGRDYAAASGTLDWADGDSADKTFAVTVNDDALDEPDETVNLSLSSPAGGATLGAQGASVLTITDNDAAPTLSVGDATLAEGDSGSVNMTFAVTLSAASGQTVTASYATSDATAVSPGDYAAASGTLSFAPGETAKFITVSVKGDATNEADETFFINLSGVTGATLAAAQGLGTILNDDTPRLSFAQASFPAAESSHFVTVTVTRSGDSSGAVAVDFATSDGTATERGDYTAASGRVRFAAGETSKTFDVLLTDDSYQEPEETINLTLSNPTGGASLGAQAAAVVRIEADDNPPPASNPMDASTDFVRQHYHDFLNREPDDSGLAFWTGGITSCGADLGCREVKQVDTSAAFFLSIEFQETGYLVYRMHKAAFGNVPGAPVPVRLADILLDSREIGQGLVVNSDGWQQKLEANKQLFSAAFTSRPRFAAAYPQSMTPEQYVDALNSNAGGVLSPAERDALVSELKGNVKTRAQVLRAVAEDPDMERKEKSRAFVLMQYFGYLRRDPDSGPDTDFGGYNFWLGKLDEFGGDYRRAEMVRAFIQSIEYRKRFGQ